MKYFELKDMKLYQVDMYGTLADGNRTSDYDIIIDESGLAKLLFKH